MIIMMYRDHTHSTGINRAYDNNDDYYMYQVQYQLIYKLYPNLLSFFSPFSKPLLSNDTLHSITKHGNSDFQLKLKAIPS